MQRKGVVFLISNAIKIQIIFRLVVTKLYDFYQFGAPTANKNENSGLLTRTNLTKHKSVTWSLQKCLENIACVAAEFVSRNTSADFERMDTAMTLSLCDIGSATTHLQPTPWSWKYNVSSKTKRVMAATPNEPTTNHNA